MRNSALSGWVSGLLLSRRHAFHSDDRDKGGLSLEWLLVVGFLVVAAGVVALAYSHRIETLLTNLGG